MACAHDSTPKLSIAARHSRELFNAILKDTRQICKRPLKIPHVAAENGRRTKKNTEKRMLQWPE